MKTNRRVLLVIILAISSFYVGFYLNPRLLYKELRPSVFYTTEENRRLSEKMEEFIKTYSAVKGMYVDEKSVDELFDLAMKGMVSGLDPYSHLFIGPEVEPMFKKFSDSSYDGGVGMSILSSGKNIQITEVFEGYPAAKAGIEPGDLIIKVDGNSVYGMSPQEVTKLVVGKEGTTVSIEIRGVNLQKPKTLILVRQKIEVDSVVYKDIDSHISYIKVRSFTDKTTNKFFLSLLATKDKDGLIIDLRNNPGGNLDTVIDMVSYFIGPDRLVINAKGRILNHEYKTKNVPNISIKYPRNVIVLVNNFSASASEVMAGDLKYYGIAKIVGVRTFGKATVQDYVDVDKPNAIPDKNTKLLLGVTVARYYLPDGVDISSTGVTPDIEVEQSANFSIYDFTTSKDTQFQAALKLLKGN